jgi:hypothetical protein
VRVTSDSTRNAHAFDISATYSEVKKDTVVGNLYMRGGVGRNSRRKRCSGSAGSLRQLKHNKHTSIVPGLARPGDRHRKRVTARARKDFKRRGLDVAIEFTEEELQAHRVQKLQEGGTEPDCYAGERHRLAKTLEYGLPVAFRLADHWLPGFRHAKLVGEKRRNAGSLCDVFALVPCPRVPGCMK